MVMTSVFSWLWPCVPLWLRPVQPSPSLRGGQQVAPGLLAACSAAVPPLCSPPSCVQSFTVAPPYLHRALHHALHHAQPQCHLEAKNADLEARNADHEARNADHEAKNAELHSTVKKLREKLKTKSADNDVGKGIPIDYEDYNRY